MEIIKSLYGLIFCLVFFISCTKSEINLFDNLYLHKNSEFDFFENDTWSILVKEGSSYRYLIQFGICEVKGNTEYVYIKKCEEEEYFFIPQNFKENEPKIVPVTSQIFDTSMEVTYHYVYPDFYDIK